MRERDHEKVYFAAGDGLRGGWEVGLPALGNRPMSIRFARFVKNGFCRLWSEEGEFSVPIPSPKRTARVTFSCDEKPGFAEVTQAETLLYSGKVNEGTEQTLTLASAVPLKIRLKHAGVYAIEVK